MADDISLFFSQITGKTMLPYQQRYAQRPFEPTLMQIPTGLGKTLTVMVPWLHAVSCGKAAPTRLIIVLPRQNLTEQTLQNRGRSGWSRAT
jgi:reverse gyrase